MGHEIDYCQHKAAQKGSSFYYSFLFLKPEQRQAIMAIYAFCREVDDIVDECQDKEIAAKKLRWWQEEIQRLFNQTPQHPVSLEILKAQKHFSLPKEYFDQILEGMWMDLTYQGYQTFDDLRLYCHRVASVVGLLAIEIFGYQHAETQTFAKHLGLAFQLVNIIRDVGEDAQRGRVYLPEEDLKRFNLTPQDIFQKNYGPNFVELMKFQAERAREQYRLAEAALSVGDRRAQKASLIMAEIYFTLLDEIEETGFKVLEQRIALTPLRKLWIAWRTSRRINKICAMTDNAKTNKVTKKAETTEIAETTKIKETIETTKTTLIDQNA